MSLFLGNYVLILGWILTVVVVMSGGMVIMVWFLNHLTAEINVWKEIKRKNMAMGLVMAGALIAIGLIVGMISK